MGTEKKDKKHPASSPDEKDRKTKKSKVSAKPKRKKASPKNEPKPDRVGAILGRTQPDEIPPGEGPGTDKADPTNIPDVLRQEAQRAKTPKDK